VNILLVSPAVPLPGEAGSPRTYQFARAIASRHRISLVVIDSDVESSVDPNRFLGRDSPFQAAYVIPVLRDLSSVCGKILNAMSLNPWFATHIKRKTEHRHAVSTVHRLSEDADVVWVDGLFMLQYAEGCSPPIVIDVVDLMSRLGFSQAMAVESPIRRLIDRRRATRVRRYERKHLSDAHATILNSSVDADVMSADTGLRASVIVNGCDTGFFEPHEPRGTLPGSPSLLFVGNFIYQPNHDAALFILDDLAPLLIQRFPQPRPETRLGESLPCSYRPS
jgi:glycosyltransferase involved in cell wall biosynthesis